MKRDKTISKKENLFAASRFVLPEHRELYLQLKEEQIRYEPPVLDEDEKAALSQSVWECMQERASMRVRYYDGRVSQDIRGLVTHIDQAAGRLKLNTLQGVEWISFDVLQEVERL